MIGTDTPEMVKPNTPPQPNDKEASEYTKQRSTCYNFSKGGVTMSITQTAERQELHQTIDALPDDSVIAMLGLLKSLQSSTGRFDTDDGLLPHIPNAETIAAIREGREGKREKVTIDQIMAELNAGN